MSGVSQTAFGSAYLVLRGDRSRHFTGSVTSCSVVRVTQRKPPKLGKDEVAIKVRVGVPAKAFEPLEPSFQIIISEEMLVKDEDVVLDALVAE